MSEKMPWEIFLDQSYYDLWCVRPNGDMEFGSPRSFHFLRQEDAEAFKKLAEKSF